jgi:hypothetical protein
VGVLIDHRAISEWARSRGPDTLLGSRGDGGGRRRSVRTWQPPPCNPAGTGRPEAITIVLVVAVPVLVLAGMLGGFGTESVGPTRLAVVLILSGAPALVLLPAALVLQAVQPAPADDDESPVPRF